MDRGYPAWKFYTSYSEEFISWHNSFYSRIEKNNKIHYIKTIKPDIKKYLTDPYSLAIWFCDDGTLRTDCDSARIATQGFTKSEVLLLMDSLKENYNIVSGLETWKNKKNQPLYGIALRAKDGNWNKFRDLIKDTIQKEIPSMSYKLYNKN